MTSKAIVYLTLALCAAFPCMAKNDPESVHVRVELFSGDTLSGYLRSDLKTGLKNMFSKSGSIIQYINLGEQPKGGDTRRMSASEVKQYRFLEPTESYPEGAVVVSERINSPIPFKPNASVRGFAWEMDRRDCGSILSWNVWETTGGRNSISRLVPAIGVKLKGAKAAYPIMVNGRVTLAQLLIYLKKRHPELKSAVEQYYSKGKDSKAHTKELAENPSTFLQFYEEFLKTHDPIVDPDEEVAPGQKVELEEE